MDNIHIKKSKTIAFTGHRHINADNIAPLREELTHTIREQYHNGYTTYNCGWCSGIRFTGSRDCIGVATGVYRYTIIVCCSICRASYLFQK